jgi:hypothetical protein
MKKIFYVFLIAFSSSLVISSCTEEQVEPTSTEPNLGGAPSETTK